MAPQRPEDTPELKVTNRGLEPQESVCGGLREQALALLGVSYFTSMCLSSLVWKLVLLCPLFHLQKEGGSALSVIAIVRASSGGHEEQTR